MMFTEKDFYLCYSARMMRYLKDKGIKYLFSGKDIRTDRVFYAYYRCDKLMDIVHRWDEIADTIEMSDSSN